MVPRRFPMTVVLALLGLGLTGFGRCGSSWKVAWEDEFEGAAGRAPSATSWSAEVGTGWGNAQLEYDTDRPENASLDGAGHLAITALKEEVQGSHYSSARLLTKGKRTQTHGRIEASIKLPTGQGLWPAFWLLGSNIDEVGWPSCGEIDVMEYRGQQPSVVQGSLHGPGYSGGNPVTASYTLPSPGRFDDDFHLFAIEWDEGQIAWEVDGEVYQVVTRSSLAQLHPGAPWVFDRPFYVLLNLAVGGSFVGPPDVTTTFPQTMLVDFVRVLERDP